MRSRFLLCYCALVLLAGAEPPLGEQYDVVVVSGSSGGFGAALAAGRMGARVALIEDTPVLGGMLSNGISNIDTYSYQSLSGIFEEFRLRVKEHYAPLIASDPIFAATDRPAGLPRYVARQTNAARDGGRWEPHVADRILKQMIATVPNVRVFYNRYPVDVVLRGHRLLGVVVEDTQGRRTTVLGEVVIDATHEGDIAAWAGVPYDVGREARSPLEPHAGEIYIFNQTGEILPGSTGREDRAVVSYGLRLTIQNGRQGDGRAHILAAPPPGYNRDDYLESSYDGELTMPNGKSEMNVNPVGNEMQEINWSWPEAGRAERRRLYEIYRNHALGFLYFLQHERGLINLGLPQDEFTDNGHVPYRVFVREARRIRGEARMTEADINPFLAGREAIPPVKSDSIAVGHYPMDSKPVRRKMDLATPDKGNGDFFLANVTTAFQVPYGAIVPVQVDGMLTPVAISATHVAFSAVRMDPTWMAMGQAAGVAAVLSLRERVDVRHLPVERLQRELLRQKCRLMFYWDLPLDHPAFSAIQWLSVRKVVTGYPDRQFRPDQPLSRAEAAVLVVKGLGMWPSVSNDHFSDVPPQHWAFREIETLFDNGLLEAFGARARWPEAGAYRARQHSGFGRGRAFASFEPERPVRWSEWIDILRRGSKGPPKLDPAAVNMDAAITRGEACILLASVLERKHP